MIVVCSMYVVCVGYSSVWMIAVLCVGNNNPLTPSPFIPSRWPTPAAGEITRWSLLSCLRSSLPHHFNQGWLGFVYNYIFRNATHGQGFQGEKENGKRFLDSSLLRSMWLKNVCWFNWINIHRKIRYCNQLWVKIRTLVQQDSSFISFPFHVHDSVHWEFQFESNPKLKDRAPVQETD